MPSCTLLKTSSSLFEVLSVQLYDFLFDSIFVLEFLASLLFNSTSKCGWIYVAICSIDFEGNQLIDPDIYLRSLVFGCGWAQLKNRIFASFAPFFFSLLEFTIAFTNTELLPLKMIPNRMMTVLSNFMGQLWPRKSGSSYNLDATESTTA